MNVEVNGKTYCVETLIADNERLRKEIIESAKTNRLVLDSVRVEIEQIEINGYIRDVECFSAGINVALNVIDKYRKGANEK